MDASFPAKGIIRLSSHVRSTKFRGSEQSFHNLERAVGRVWTTQWIVIHVDSTIAFSDFVDRVDGQGVLLERISG
jgi:hypothetical protein